MPSKSYHDEVVGDLSEEDKEGLMMQVRRSEEEALRSE